MRNFLLNLLERFETTVHKFNGNGNGNGNGKHPIPELIKHELSLENTYFRTTTSTTQKTENPLDDSIDRAQRYLINQQNITDGHWVGILEADTTLTSDYIMLMHFLNKVDYEKQGKAVAFLMKQQLTDGGWNIYYGGASEIIVLPKFILPCLARLIGRQYPPFR